MPLYHPRNKRNKKEKRNQIKENRLKKKEKIKINIRVQVYHNKYLLSLDFFYLLKLQPHSKQIV